MKSRSINSIIKMVGITAIVVAVMFKTAFCQGPFLTAAIKNYKLVVAAGKQANFRLPQDIRSGDTISGTVVEDPADKKNPQNNSSTLEGMVIEIDGRSTQLSKHFVSFIVPAGLASIPFLLKNAAGQVIDHGQIPVIPSNFSVPVTGNPVLPQTVVLPGEPLSIGGAFDGDATNTNVSLNSQPCEVIAESPRQSFVEVPKTTTAGTASVYIKENNNTTTTKVHVAVLNLSADKISLRKGEKTNITVRVSGLEGLSSGNNLRLTIENLSPQTVVFKNESSNMITKEINTTSVTKGTYELSTRIIGITAGAFNIRASLTQPSTNNPCVDKYLARMEEIKLSKEKAMADCNNALCKANAEAAAEKLEKECADEFIKCEKNK